MKKDLRSCAEIPIKEDLRSTQNVDNSEKLQKHEDLRTCAEIQMQEILRITQNIDIASRSNSAHWRQGADLLLQTFWINNAQIFMF